MELRFISNNRVCQKDPMINRREIVFELLHDFNMEELFNKEEDINEVIIAIKPKIFKKKYTQKVEWELK